MLSKTFASNQLCTNYEYKNKDFKNLAIRERYHPSCGIHHDNLKEIRNISQQLLK
ncbi:hypothetical protein NHG45_04515 [Bacillus thuringiensis]|nr:hypothetical protein [Bacillus thuringiensis]MCR6814710.1 hypothetical protein [Bacillus thuringiensis]